MLNIEKGGVTMPKFRQTDDIMKLMGNKNDIRNIGIIAHIDHGNRD
jgi:elongation factor 2